MNSAGTRRLFWAVELSTEVRQAAGSLISQLKGDAGLQAFRISWSRPENVHLTLKFLGNVQAERVPLVIAAGQQLAAQHQPFSFGVTGVGSFSTRGRPSVVWAGVSDATGALVRLAESLDRAMNDLGFSPETRAYSPHLTLGRVKGAKARVLEVKQFEGTVFGTTPVNEIILFESILNPAGAEYHVLARVKVGAI